MSQRIGIFVQQANGVLLGKLDLLTCQSDLKFMPDAPTASGKGPVYRVHAGDVEVGAAWEKAGTEHGTVYHSVKIDSPELPAPINARLFQQSKKPGAFDLVWERAKPRQPGQEG